MTHHDKDQPHEAGKLYSQIAQENEQVVEDLQAAEAAGAKAAGAKGDGLKTAGKTAGETADGEDLAQQANEAVADARQKGAEAAAALREGAQHLAQDVAKMGGTAREFVQTYAREGVREAKAFEQAARARLDAHARTVCDKAKEGKEQVRGQMRERPGAVLAGVAALGFVAGLLAQSKKPKGKLPGRGDRWH